MKPHIYVVGIGPGSEQGMTLEAKAVLEGCDCIVGYHTYIDLIRSYFPDKEFVVTGMTQEVARCRLVLERALEGQKVAIVSSGDARLMAQDLGAPLIADACLISLSDLLTPWDKIENRLDCAAAGDFVICLYNPASKKRSDYLEKACDIILRHQSAHTPAGIVRNIGRDGQDVKILTLGELRTQHLDMFCTVFIGNSQTKILNGKLVTPRGYRL